ncbi:hypothetical protein RO3G_05907 [Rhizopus delemar RA 99-880]|uniref:Uncharacterized protein n=1 Tax=Rhizopus delemar (strain RA 99-880 / ATCC MYA-4621 / FGSC 9543 / NRRL 43880) TaxID=246409 RepID=I1BYC2_RHIO9|nr:hypothetical protein RO3G_05907 [Rhizopus delemar RA 99-880]|eukprot:EIE81202.1 hypothetical protein RO3G_05907 [Rhizopus delemar RA 99-880]
MANPSAFDARFPFAGKILTVDWTSDEEDGPEDANGRTFVVKRPSFRSNEVKNVEVEFPDKLDDTDFPSWAFSSPDLGFPTSVSASSSSFAAANPMQ